MLNFHVKIRGKLFLLKIHTLWEYFWNSHKEAIAYELLDPLNNPNNYVITRYNARSIRRVASYPYYYM